MDWPETLSPALVLASKPLPIDKYARPERERRFLLTSVPQSASNPRRIHDRYLTGTRLRLRRIEDLSGTVDQLKLGHKVRPEESDPRLVLHTSLYLRPAEYETLNQLKGHGLVKVRYRMATHSASAVDVFEGHLTGLIMLEVDFESEDELADFDAPHFAGPEVTGNEAFSGRALAAADQPPNPPG